jgi:hypothetical protein
VPRSNSSAAAALYFWYSSSRRTSSARGSSSSSPGRPSSSCPEGTDGKSIFDLMCASVAAITRYSLATSIVSVRMIFR